MPFIEKSHLCKFSKEEALLLSNTEDIQDACDVLHEVGTKVITITLGKEGTLVSCGGVREIIPSISVKAIDTTGAGDAFIGCLLYQISHLDKYEQVFKDTSLLFSMVQKANKAGALTTTQYGAIPALPSKSQLEN